MADDAAAANHSTAYLTKSLTVLFYIWWPIGVLLNSIATFVLDLAKLLYWPIGFLLQPVIYLARFILTCLLAPFRLLVKLETLYIYLGTAALVGLIIGLIISLIYGSLSNIIGPNTAPAAAAQSRLRSAREYRETKKRKKQNRPLPDEPSAILSPAPASSPIRVAQRDQLPAGYGGGGGMSDHVRRSRRFHGLLDQTIMEATDSDF